MLVKLDIVGENHEVFSQTHVTHTDDDHTISKFLLNVHLDDGNKTDAALVLKVLTGCSFHKLENINV